MIIQLLNSLLKIEKAKLKALDECYASYSNTTLPLQKATEAAIKEIKKQIKEIEESERYVLD